MNVNISGNPKIRVQYLAATEQILKLDIYINQLTKEGWRLNVLCHCVYTAGFWIRKIRKVHSLVLFPSFEIMCSMIIRGIVNQFPLWHFEFYCIFRWIRIQKIRIRRLKCDESETLVYCIKLTIVPLLKILVNSTIT